MCENIITEIGHFLNCRIAPFLGVKQTNEVGEGYAILITSFFAILIGLLAYWFSLRRDKIIQRNTGSDEFLTHTNKELRDTLMNIGSVVLDERKIKKDSPAMHLHSEEIHSLLSRYEILAVSIKRGTVSERFIFDAERGLILKVFNSLSEYIYQLRYMQKNTSICKNYHSMVKRMLLGRWRMYKLVEIVVGEPVYWLSDAVFWLQYRFYILFYGGSNNTLLVNYRDLDESFKKIRTRFILFFLIVILVFVSILIIA